MKKLNFLAAALVSAMTLFTSCLGNGGNEAEFSATGIVFLNDKAGFKQMVDVGSAYLYIPQLETAEYGEGDCVAVGVHVDYNSPENANWGTTGYLTASLTGQPSVIEQYRASFITSEADTTQILPNELPLVSAFQASMFNNYVRGWLIFPSTLKVGSKQVRNLMFKMMYPRELKAEEINGKRYYNLYLRATTEGDDTGASNTSIINAYYLKDVIDRADAIEKAEGNKSYYLKFNFVSEIDKDNNTLTWDYEEAQMAVTDDSSSM